MRRGLSSALRRLLVLPVALSLAVALVVPTTAFAANSTTGYNQTPPSTTGYNQTPPSTTGYNQTPPSAGTSPSKEKSAPAKAPAKEVAPATKSSVPTTTKSTKASTLPFTGFDLRWTVGIGLLLMGMGFLIVMVQRRQRRSTGR
jgi:cytoskeletal protein RodZ